MKSADIIQLIADKRDGRALGAAGIADFVSGVVDGSVREYQAAALLMAVFLRGLDTDETTALTEAIARSGRVLDFSDLGTVVDKHSTGGVGDSVSLIAAPLAAAAGLKVPMLSGRALAHSGGTLDKLESIPGFDVHLDSDRLRGAVAAAGCAIAEAGPELAPGDAVLYRLRDATATVAEHGLITASILGKKLCVSPSGLVMDLKTGRGSFVGDAERARQLADRMAAVAARLDLRIHFMISDMDRPLSSAVGNAVEVERSIRILRGDINDDAPGMHGRDLRELSLHTAGAMLALGGIVTDVATGRDKAESLLASGDGLEAFRGMVRAQGGDTRVVDDLGRLPAPTATAVVSADRSGLVTDIDARGVGLAAAELGVGRGEVDTAADPAAGLVLEIAVGDQVTAGAPLARTGAATRARLDACGRRLAGAVSIG